MNSYKYGLGDSCCTGKKVSIYKLENNKREVVETHTNFNTIQEAEEFAKNRIIELEENNE